MEARLAASAPHPRLDESAGQEVMPDLLRRQSDVIVGLDAATLSSLDGSGESWRTTGRYGLVQAKL
ncbi:MAG TPA: hypothetical protein VGR21_03520 [Cryptosporangiaceae bacterium]|nr:hypothetical protein [Cryptosporangiaceae bacterium]